MGNNIFDKTESLIREFAEIRDHNARFKTLYEELCNDELLRHYKTFSGVSKEHIKRELERIEHSVQAIGKSLTSASGTA